ncbi:hypothetical protein BT96DRAFT_972775 [Gymnopus androsaceus JB14]|uniref:Uncharacterized protein n=1 Tax=Gymnopus androsaceus JB14 TaxID=1447944 RepID=A0A6A4I774_9AGAR|nr:hypothetical protein BT96DRAFT_972775 [Gymnopus androsaceus JB14]
MDDKIIDERLTLLKYATELPIRRSCHSVMQVLLGKASPLRTAIYEFPPNWAHFKSTGGKMLVLEGYGPAEKFILDLFEKWDFTGAVLIGNPGTGKTSFLHYLLWHELARRRTVIFYEVTRTLVFTANRVYKLNEDINRRFLLEKVLYRRSSASLSSSLNPTTRSQPYPRINSFALMQVRTPCTQLEAQYYNKSLGKKTMCSESGYEFGSFT